MAYMADEELEELLDKMEFTPHTPTTITERAALKAALREAGFALTRYDGSGRDGPVAVLDVICTATAGRLMRKGVAENLFVKEGSPKSVYDFIKDAHEAGAKFYCCSPNLDLFDMSEEDLIPECEGIVGGAKVIESVMEDDNAKVLTY